MTVEVKHEFQTAKGDGPDTSFVRPSDWNAAHEFTITGPAIVGRIDPGAGGVAEIPLGAGLSFSGGNLGVTLPQFPVGTVIDYAGNTEPAGWLFCFGQTVLRSEFATLFAAIGTAFGVGDGVNTFNLPDCRGRARVGKDNMGGTAANRVTTTVDGKVLGNVVGTEKHVLATSHLPSHTHTGTTAGGGNHWHFIAHSSETNEGSATLNATEALARANTAGLSYRLNGVALDEDTQPNVGRTTEVDAHTHTFTTAGAGSGEGHLNMQPSIIFNSIIFTGVVA